MYRSLIALIVIAAMGCEDPKQTPSRRDRDDNNDVECTDDDDCAGGNICDDGECVRSQCSDGLISGDESDVDCGGSCVACAIGWTCNQDSDCFSGFCAEGSCDRPTPENGITPPDPTCEDPGDPLRFEPWDNGISHNVEYVATGLEVLQFVGPFLTNAIAIVDFDGDGDVDVLSTSQGNPPGYFVNDGTGTFTNETSGSGLASLTRVSSISAADFDGDGDVDLVLGRQEEGVYVMINQGDGTFVDETAARGIGEATDVVSSGTFGDFDGDGDLDFYMGTYFPPLELSVPFSLPDSLPNRLYRNDGSGFFTEMSYSPGGDGESGTTLAVAWWDFDQDGLLDLWASNDWGMNQQPSQLWRNLGPDPADPNGWLWEDISASSGVGVAIFGMSTTLADFDNDGDQDGYASNIAQNVLHVVEAGTTENQALPRGVACDVLVDPRSGPADPPVYEPDQEFEGMDQFIADYADAESEYYVLTSWAANFFDANHDGWLDLHVVNGAANAGAIMPEAVFMPNYLFMSRGNGTFEQSPCWTIPDVRGTSRGAAVGDLDGDGDLDMIWSDQGWYGQAAVHVARNEMASGNWLIVKLRGDAPNVEAIGAKVQLAAAGLVQTRWIDGGQSYLSVSERIAHFGIGAADTIDSLDITWPDGSTQTVTVDNVNQRLVVQKEQMQ